MSSKSATSYYQCIQTPSLSLIFSDPAMLGMMPDEEAMMNFAIAMSLHEEVGGASPAHIYIYIYA